MGSLDCLHGSYFINFLICSVLLCLVMKNSLNSLTDGVVLTQNDLKAQFTLQ